MGPWLFLIAGAPSTYFCLHLSSATYGVKQHEFSRHSTGLGQVLTVRSKVLVTSDVAEFMPMVRDKSRSSGVLVWAAFEKMEEPT